MIQCMKQQFKNLNIFYLKIKNKEKCLFYHFGLIKTEYILDFHGDFETLNFISMKNSFKKVFILTLFLCLLLLSLFII